MGSLYLWGLLNLTDSNGKNNGEDTERNANGTFKAGNNVGFQKGHSGNPDGRKNSITDIIRKQLDQEYDDDRTYKEEFVRVLLNTSLKGNTKAQEMVMDRIDGKVNTPMSIETHDPIKLIETGTLLDDRNKPNGVKNGVKNGVLNGG